MTSNFQKKIILTLLEYQNCGFAQKTQWSINKLFCFIVYLMFKQLQPPIVNSSAVCIAQFVVLAEISVWGRIETIVDAVKKKNRKLRIERSENIKYYFREQFIINVDNSGQIKVKYSSAHPCYLKIWAFALLQQKRLQDFYFG